MLSTGSQEILGGSTYSIKASRTLDELCCSSESELPGIESELSGIATFVTDSADESSEQARKDNAARTRIFFITKNIERGFKLLTQQYVELVENILSWSHVIKPFFSGDRLVFVVYRPHNPLKFRQGLFPWEYTA